MHSQTKVIQLVPRLPPVVDGLGDYALLLARKLRETFGIHTHFLVGDPDWTGPLELEGFPVSQVSDRTSHSLQDLLNTPQGSTLILHYVGYGYAKRGCPTWLIDGIWAWKKSTHHSHLVTMFHEVYAAGRPPWTSAFWLFLWQKQIASRLVQLSDSIVTSKKLYADILQTLGGCHLNIPVLPIFSNIGEPENPPPLHTRAKKLVVFGGSTNRRQVYQQASTTLRDVCQLLGIEEIVDIGPRLTSLPQTIANIPILEMGPLTAPTISQIFLQSSVGFLNYNPDYLAKSGIFAAYCAHGLLPINVRGSLQPIDGLTAGKQYWVPRMLGRTVRGEFKEQAIASNANIWYQEHCLSVHARVMFAQLNVKA
jgi:hypothetical protein